jgi:hypothetical protein
MANESTGNMRANVFVVMCALASVVVAALVGVLSLMMHVGIIISLIVMIIRWGRARTD